MHIFDMSKQFPLHALLGLYSCDILMGELYVTQSTTVVHA